MEVQPHSKWQIVQMGVVQLGVVQLGVVQLGVVQMGVDRGRTKNELTLFLSKTNK